jgi:hypothetical protein
LRAARGAGREELAPALAVEKTVETRFSLSRTVSCDEACPGDLSPSPCISY